MCRTAAYDVICVNQLRAKPSSSSAPPPSIQLRVSSLISIKNPFCTINCVDRLKTTCINRMCVVDKSGLSNAKGLRHFGFCKCVCCGYEEDGGRFGGTDVLAIESTARRWCHQLRGEHQQKHNVTGNQQANKQANKIENEKRTAWTGLYLQMVDFEERQHTYGTGVCSVYRNIAAMCTC